MTLGNADAPYCFCAACRCSGPARATPAELRLHRRLLMVVDAGTPAAPVSGRPYHDQGAVVLAPWPPGAFERRWSTSVNPRMTRR
jgi:hypothetical protein